MDLLQNNDQWVISYERIDRQIDEAKGIHPDIAALFAATISTTFFPYFNPINIAQGKIV
jgi:hypothetical protein